MGPLDPNLSVDSREGKVAQTIGEIADSAGLDGDTGSARTDITPLGSSEREALREQGIAVPDGGDKAASKALRA